MDGRGRCLPGHLERGLQDPQTTLLRLPETLALSLPPPQTPPQQSYQAPHLQMRPPPRLGLAEQRRSRRKGQRLPPSALGRQSLDDHISLGKRPQ